MTQRVSIREYGMEVASDEHIDAVVDIDLYHANTQRRSIQIAGLKASQDHVNPKGVDQFVENTVKAKTPVHVVKYRGQSIILDGHHRIVAAILKGRSTVIARFQDLDLP